jgi:hypothetical protein
MIFVSLKIFNVINENTKQEPSMLFCWKAMRPYLNSHTNICLVSNIINGHKQEDFNLFFFQKKTFLATALSTEV